MTKKKKYIKIPKANPSTPQKPAEEERIVKFSFDPLVQNVQLKTNKSLIQNILGKRDNKPLITLVLAEKIQLMPNIILPLFDILRSVGTNEKIDLFLSTTGGATEVPWRIVSILREFCKSYTAVVPFIAMSAGTHIALGADSILMSEISTLGPVDPSTHHALQPVDKAGRPVPVSVEDLKNCIKFITQQLKDQDKEGKYSPTDMAQIVGKLFEHIEPLAIGAVERSYSLSRLITQKVLETHLDPEKDKDKIAHIVDKIGGQYFSHAFPITRRDVAQELHLEVEKPDKDLFNAIWQLYIYYQNCLKQEQSITLTLENAGPGGPKKKNINYSLRVLGFIDSIVERRVLVQLREISKDPKDGKITDRIVFTNWVHPSSVELAESDGNFFHVKLPGKPIPIGG